MAGEPHGHAMMGQAVREFVLVLENRPGALGAFDTALGRAGVNIAGYALQERGDTGVLRFIVDDPQRAQGWFQASGHAAEARDALAVPAPEAPRPGFVGGIAERLAAAGFNIEASYTADLAGRRHVVFSVADAAGAAKALG